MLSALPGMAVAAHRFGSAAFIDCKPPLFRGEGDRVSGGGVSGWMGHKGGGLASLCSPTGLQMLRTGGGPDSGFAADMCIVTGIRLN